MRARASASRTASQNRRIASASLMPREDSTPELTSTAQGRTRLNALDDISGMQPTRQNDRTGHVGWNERPIEDLSTAAEALDMGVEQEGLGMRSCRAEV